MLSSCGKLVTGSCEGSLQLWLVDSHQEDSATPLATPPTVTLGSSMEVDGGSVSSANFNSGMEMVRSLVNLYVPSVIRTTLNSLRV